MQFDWVRVYNGIFTGGEDAAQSIFIDYQGNILVTGEVKMDLVHMHV